MVFCDWNTITSGINIHLYHDKVKNHQDRSAPVAIMELPESKFNTDADHVTAEHIKHTTGPMIPWPFLSNDNIAMLSHRYTKTLDENVGNIIIRSDCRKEIEEKSM